jgi:hypothetical protein
MNNKEIIAEMKESGEEQEITSYNEQYDVIVPGGWSEPNYETRNCTVVEMASFSIATQGKKKWFLDDPTALYKNFTGALESYYSNEFVDDEILNNAVAIVKFEMVLYHSENVDDEIRDMEIIALFHPQSWETL